MSHQPPASGGIVPGEGRPTALTMSAGRSIAGREAPGEFARVAARGMNATELVRNQRAT
jgi:hypothetical protein